MADENKEKEQVEEKETKQEKLSFKNADELSTFLMDLQGQIGNMQETIDKLSPVDEKGKEQEEQKEEKEKIGRASCREREKIKANSEALISQAAKWRHMDG